MSEHSRLRAAILRPSTLRFSIQAAFTLFCLYVGYRFYGYVTWMTGKSEIMVPKPPSVEAFLPISALMAAKRFFMTGLWDTIHPAGLTLFLAFVLMAALFRKGFCAYICPVGFVSSCVERVGRRLKLSRDLPPLAARLLSVAKYLMLGRFMWFIVFTMPLAGINGFLNAPYNMVADAKMLQFFLSPTTTTLAVVFGLAVISLVIRNAWCRFLCPYGALLGLASLCSPVTVTRDAAKCISCKACRRICPSGVPVDTRTHMNTPECMGCTACIEACPVDTCMQVRALSRPVPYWTIALGTVALLLAAYIWARMTGHWESAMPLNMLRRLHMMQLGG